ncbi:S8 family serine peptidase [Dyadobacter sediminis]|uniref:Peptidase S8/S53 domain-containing protein n=1 Tax=Dyadobacter sediminis TaxID=1493691 RepID=A0A5R9KK42_9BACT|nr:S8 family serine peptidase [Dyadobacter sediminis]TLU96436.1 hypothetical protein FEM55_04700 [Dyadobacter sediminis]GGB82201.1 hypothetical protein GCM10011325_07150 [Dyadobacter sediminis]
MEKKPSGDLPLWIRRSKKNKDRYASLFLKTYKQNQICVFFKELPTTEDIANVKNFLLVTAKEINGRRRSDSNEVEVIKCDDCGCLVVLFIGELFHTVINAEGVVAGSVPSPPVVGEYSHNYFNSSPFEKEDFNVFSNYSLFQKPKDIDNGKEKIVVAVLDTGFDDQLIDPQYLWKSQLNDSSCYKEVESGWNFSEMSSGNTGNPDFRDDNPYRHGTAVSMFIINEFLNSQNNAVEIMPLKTHNANGQGDFFGIICAIHFAMAKGANMINASWGFYYYYRNQFAYFDHLINKTLKESGILFVTAAGNKFADEELIAKEIYLAEYGLNITDEQLRNLAIHHFYPADLSIYPNSVLTVTTTDGKSISSTQNFSSRHVDLGVFADEGMKFYVPFYGKSCKDMISGSSFATAIATGVIGAFGQKKLLRLENMDKTQLLHTLTLVDDSESSPAVMFDVPELEFKHIKKGTCTRKTS